MENTHLNTNIDVVVNIYTFTHRSQARSWSSVLDLYLHLNINYNFIAYWTACRQKQNTEIMNTTRLSFSYKLILFM